MSVDEQRERDIASLAQAARDILEYVADPGDRPQSYITMTTEFRHPKSPAEIARQQADQMERQSRAVRTLKRELEKWTP